MNPFTVDEVQAAIAKISPQAQLELQNAMLAARVEAYESEMKDDDGIHEEG